MSTPHNSPGSVQDTLRWSQKKAPPFDCSSNGQVENRFSRLELVRSDVQSSELVCPLRGRVCKRNTDEYIVVIQDINTQFPI